MLRLRQVAAAVSALEPSVAKLCETLDLAVAFRDPGVAVFGLENAVLPVGDTFLELVAPVREGTTAGRYMERRGGDAGYMVILQTDDLAPHRARLARCGVRIAWEGSAAPAGEHGPRWTGIHLHPKDTGGALLSLDHPEPPDSWIAAGLHWRDPLRTRVVDELLCAELRSDDPQRLGHRWAEVLGRELAHGEIALDRGGLRFTRAAPGEGEGFHAVELRATDRSRAGEEHRIAGLCLRLC